MYFEYEYNSNKKQKMTTTTIIILTQYVLYAPYFRALNGKFVTKREKKGFLCKVELDSLTVMCYVYIYNK